MGEGHVVLVDVTADWCINCQINKLLVLDRGWAADALASGKVIGLKADWTNPDPPSPAISRASRATAFPSTRSTDRARRRAWPCRRVLSEEAVRQAVEQAGK